MRGRPLRVFTAVATVVASGLFAASSFAAASGLIWWGDVHNSEGCRGIYLNSVVYEVSGSNLAQHGGTVAPHQCFPGAPRQSLPAGWMAIDVGGWQDGGFCGSSGWQYTTSATTSHGHNDAYCFNPAGLQNFYTDVGALAWNGSGYDFFGYQFSPVLQK